LIVAKIKFLNTLSDTIQIKQLLYKQLLLINALMQKLGVYLPSMKYLWWRKSDAESTPDHVCLMLNEIGEMALRTYWIEFPNPVKYAALVLVMVKEGVEVATQLAIKLNNSKTQTIK